MSHIDRRSISDHDAQVVAGVSGAVIKAGVAAATLVAVGPVAAIGAALASELTGVVLESQRERLADFAGRFAKRTAEIPADAQNRIRAQLQTDAGSRIFETAWHQAAQEVDPEKLDFIAALLKNSLSSDVLQEHQTRWLLKILAELDTIQIVILQSFAKVNRNRTAFFEHHYAIFENKEHPRAPQFVASREYSKFVGGWVPQTDEERVLAERDRAELKREIEAYKSTLPAERQKYELARERHSLFRSRVHNLVERGLLGVAREAAKFSDEVDKVSEALTPLGAALLKIIDSIDHSEWGEGEQVSSVQAIQQSLVDIAQNSQNEYEALMRSL